MGHLYYVEEITPATPGLFTNVLANNYWSGTEIGLNAAWDFRFTSGRQEGVNKISTLFAWAVRSGDVPDNTNPAPAIPEPSTMVLFGTGLAGLAAWRYRKSVES